MDVKGLAGTVALLFAIAVPAVAQDTPRARAGDEPRHPRMLNVEAALRHKDLLKLSTAQAAQLESLRKEIVAERQEAARERIDVASRVAAGLASREDVHQQMDSKREAMRQKLQQRQDQISRILTQEQRDQLARTMHDHMRDRMWHQRGMRRPGGMHRGMKN